MRGISKKMLISILTSVIVFVTMVATTFAWVGIFTYANTENFNLNLKVSELNSNYYLVISPTGEKGTYSDTVPLVEMQKQILKNKKIDIKNIDELKNETISSYFDMYNRINPCTVILNDSSIDHFEKINLDKTNSFELKNTETDYLKFDLYLSIDTKEGITQDTTGIRSNVYLNYIEKSLEGINKNYAFYNGNPFLELPSSSTNDILKSIPDGFILNNSNAARFALEVFEPISIDEEYTDENSNIVETRIYQGGTQDPSYNQSTKIYNLGGCLPEDYNSALKELLYIRPNYKAHEGTLLRQKYEDAINYACNRGDLELKEDNKVVWDKNIHSSYLGCMNGVQTKMKISVYLWFEGWDADCLRAIDLTSISLNLTFTSGLIE